MTYSANVRIQTSTQDDAVSGAGIRVTLTIQSVVGFSDTKLFLSQGGVPQAVCRPADLTTYNPTTPTPPTNFVRVDTFSFYDQDADEGLATSTLLQGDLLKLCQDMQKLSVTSTDVVVVIAAP